MANVDAQRRHAICKAIAGLTVDAATVDAVKRHLSTPGLTKGTKPEHSTNRSVSGKQETEKSLVAAVSSLRISDNSQNEAFSKSQYALATDICNISLKTLSDLSQRSDHDEVRQSPSGRLRTTKDDQNQPQRVPKRTALVPRSGNEIVSRNNAPKQRHGMICANPAPSQVAIITDCARHALACLRRHERHRHDTEQSRKCATFTASLALVASLITLKHFSGAVRELHSVKSFFEQERMNTEHGRRSGQTIDSQRSADRPMVELLDIQVEAAPGVETLQLTTRYLLLVLKVITMSTESFTQTRKAIDHLSQDNPNSLIYLLSRQAEIPELKDRSIHQLQSICRLLSRHDILHSTPQGLTDASKPQIAFEFQAKIFQIRKIWWRLAGHEVDYEKEVIQPLNKYLWALVEMCSELSDSFINFVTKTVDQALSPDNLNTLASFDVYRALCRITMLSSQTERQDTALRRLRECSGRLEQSHALRLAYQSRLVTMLILRVSDRSGNELLSEEVELLSKSIGGRLSGHAREYDLLISELVALTQSMTRNWNKAGIMETCRALAMLIGGFALKYQRSCHDRNIAQVRQLVLQAIRCGNNVSDIATWLTLDVLKLLDTDHVIHTMAESRPIHEQPLTWASTPQAVLLDRVIHALTARTMLTGERFDLESRVKDEYFTPAACGSLLLRHLWHIESLVMRSKYRIHLVTVIPALSLALNDRFPNEEYPIRRSMIYRTFLQIRARAQDIDWPKVLSLWKEPQVSSDAPGRDFNLVSYLPHIKLTLQLIDEFDQSRPRPGAIMEHIRGWSVVLDGASNRVELDRRVDDLAWTISRLTAARYYLAALGEDAYCEAVTVLLHRLACAAGEDPTRRLLDVAEQHVLNGKLPAAKIALEQAVIRKNNLPVNDHEEVRRFVIESEIWIAKQNVSEARHALTKASFMYKKLAGAELEKDVRTELTLLLARAWSATATCAYIEHTLDSALAAAKQAVKIINTLWMAEEHGDSQALPSSTLPSDVSLEVDSNTVPTRVNKLLFQKIPTGVANPSTRTARQGPAFWRLIPLLSVCLLQLSDLYRHHGLHRDANYFSHQVLCKAEAIGAGRRLQMATLHRVQFLRLSGCIEEAELLVAKLPESTDPVLRMQLECARAALYSAEGSHEKALQVLQKTERYGQALLHNRKTKNSVQPEEQTRRSGRTARPTAPSPKGSRKKNELVQVGQSVKPGDESFSKHVSEEISDETAQMQSAIQAGLLSIENQKYDLVIKSGDLSTASGMSQGLPISDVVSLKPSNPLNARRLMNLVDAKIQTTLTLSVLPESVLALPALSKGCVRKRTNQAHSVARSLKRNNQHVPDLCSDTPLEDLLLSARAVLVEHVTKPVFLSCSTTDAHQVASLVSSNAMLATSIAGGEIAICPEFEAGHHEFARSHAFDFAQKVARTEGMSSTSTSALEWPVQDEPTKTLTEDIRLEFQKKFVDIMPSDWTAVAMSLDDEEKYLYISRYRSNATPFMLKIPFARHKPYADEEEDEQVFGFAEGKAELRDIIELSNISCHNTSGVEEKGARSKWWAQRTSLDQRLGKLLEDMQQLWLGGFQGMMLPRKRNGPALERFRQSFQEVLNRHLPSRKGSQRGTTFLSIDDHIVELFADLSTGKTAVDELDDQLSDLIYFVVDMLRFGGEDNALDEIDLDDMILEIGDALRSYSGEVTACVSEDDSHVVLILDKRLQLFPWENIPCLQGVSTSRLGSMLSLRQCIMAMRQDANPANPRRHEISRKCGSFILNPSSDLKNTQEMLEPLLSSLVQKEGSAWAGITNRAPREDEFSECLEKSSILLYFGHGAGNQYIRPRTVRRLNSCSEAIWLMGCSSGSVTEHGELEPEVIPMDYLICGQTDDGSSQSRNGEASGAQAPKKNRCMAVLATLWDVTDKDIDRFSLAVGADWGLWASPEQTRPPAKATERRDQLPGLMTPVRAPKTPKTPRMSRVDKPPTTTSKRFVVRSDAVLKQNVSLTEAVSRNREACFLRHLNGSAPVVYGIPVYLGQ